MEVTSGLSGQHPESGLWRKVKVTLDESDLALMLAEGKVSADAVQSVLARFSVLVDEAEILCLYEAIRLGLIDQDPGAERIQERSAHMVKIGRGAA